MNPDKHSIRIAAFTRGFDFENDYKWKAEWLGFDDKISDAPIRDLLAEFSLKDRVSIQSTGLLVSKLGAKCGMLLCGLPTDYKAARGGSISASFAFFDLDEKIAKTLAVSALQDWNVFSRNLVSALLRHAPPACNPEWSIDGDYVTKFLEGSIGASIPASGALASGTQKMMPYSEPDEPAFKEFAALVANQAFSEGDGLKVVIGKPFSPDSRERALAEADIVALPDLEQRELKKKPLQKSKTGEDIQKKKSGMRSEESGPPKSSQNVQNGEAKYQSLETKSTALQDNSWKISSTGLGTCLSRNWILAGIAIVVSLIAIRIVLAVLLAITSFLFGCPKKKDIDRPPVGPPTQSSNSVPAIEPNRSRQQRAGK